MVTQLSSEATFNEYRGLSTDEKPITNVPNGSLFIEIDTGINFLFDATNDDWVVQESLFGDESSGGGEGVTDYRYLTGKPKINGVTLSGNITLEQLGIEKELPASADEGDTIIFENGSWVVSGVIRNLDTTLNNIGSRLEGLL